MRKFAPRYITNNLTEQNRKYLFRMCQENLTKFNEGTWRLSDVATGWKLGYILEQFCKIFNQELDWRKRKRSKSDQNRSFRLKKFVHFRSSGELHVTYFDKRHTIDNQTCIEDCLKPLVRSLIS